MLLYVPPVGTAAFAISGRQYTCAEQTVSAVKITDAGYFADISLIHAVLRLELVGNLHKTPCRLASSQETPNFNDRV